MSRIVKRITQLTVLPETESIFSERATVITIEDEAAGEYLVVTQSTDSGLGKIQIDPAEWPQIRAAINELMAGMNPGKEAKK